MKYCFWTGNLSTKKGIYSSKKKENESDKTLIKYINQARLDDTEVIVILDEAHLFASRGKAAQDLLQKIYAKIEIDISATLLYHSWLWLYD